MKIMTLNIWRYDGDWNTRKPKIIEAILKEKPDIVFMQEVFDCIVPKLCYLVK
jgi:endonuclease/exonuclease/phosphatase family metal-dependent hydrolase